VFRRKRGFFVGLGYWTVTVKLTGLVGFDTVPVPDGVKVTV
jgi:hypothetical protein